MPAARPFPPGRPSAAAIGMAATAPASAADARGAAAPSGAADADGDDAAATAASAGPDATKEAPASAATLVVAQALRLVDEDLPAAVDQLESVALDASITPKSDHSSIYARELAITKLASLYAKQRHTAQLRRLLAAMWEFLPALSKPKAARLVSSVLDEYLDIGSGGEDAVALCNEAIEWCMRESRVYLRQVRSTEPAARAPAYAHGLRGWCAQQHDTERHCGAVHRSAPRWRAARAQGLRHGSRSDPLAARRAQEDR